MTIPNEALTSYIEKCYAKIDSHDVISFDIFDTLLLRPLAIPRHLFWLINDEIAKVTGDELCNFYNLRVKAEETARVIARKERGESEITLDNIYDVLGDLMCITDNDTLEKMNQTALEAELFTCYTHPVVRKLYDYAIEQGKQVIYVSDMYLPGAFLKELLKKNGYDENLPLFVSSELKRTKHNGTIYPYVLKTLGMKAKQMLHIGDNKHADVWQARRNRVATFHVPNAIDRFFQNKRVQQVWGAGPQGIANIEGSMVIGRLANHFCCHPANFLANKNEILSHDWYHFGYHVVGAMYLGFTQWLIKSAKKSEISKLFFLSRDGKIMKEVYDMVAHCFEEQIPSEYIYASRRALQIPRIKKLDSFALEFLTSSGTPIIAREYIERLGLKAEDYQQQLEAVGLSLDRVVDPTSEIHKLNAFFKSIEEEILALAEKERQPLEEYYKQVGLLDEKKPGIVDIGWRATMLYALTNTLDLKGKVPGFFFGTNKAAQDIENTGTSISSFLFKFGEPGEYHWVVHNCIEIIELLFTATHGSLTSFEKKNGKITPVLDEIDCHPNRMEIVEQIQSGAKGFIKDMLPMMERYQIATIPRNILIQPLRALILQPTVKEAEMFDDIIHIQAFGTADADRQIIHKPCAKTLFLKPFTFARIYQRVYWKIGFEKRMGAISRFYFKMLARCYNQVKWMRRIVIKLALRGI